MKLKYIVISLLVCMLCIQNLQAQKQAIIKGTVTDENNEPLPNANIRILETNIQVQANEKGVYKLTVDAEKNIVLQISYTGYEKYTRNLYLQSGEKKNIDVQLKISTLNQVEIKSNSDKTENDTRIQVEKIESIVNPSGDIGSIIKQLPGVSSNNELSGQYSVRGGNYDENLVYVNDFEVYRPFLTRSSQQEGLSFPNIDMIQSLSFSAGGFESKYGDKLSSVLDVKYKRPSVRKSSIQAGLLGAALSTEGSIGKEQRVRYLLGARYKTLRVLLGSLDTKGEYRPDFADVQANIQADLNKKWEAEALGYISFNNYFLQPQSRSTTLGTFNQVLRLNVDFYGAEQSQFFNYTTGVSLAYKPNQYAKIKLLASRFYSNEEENFDIIGVYLLGEVETDPNKEGFNEIKYFLGAGEFQNFGRNRLQADVNTLALRGQWLHKKHFVQWGTKWQIENIHDKLHEWNRLDSAGYSVPYPPDNIVNFKSNLNSKIDLQSQRYEAYVQDAITFENDFYTAKLTLGARATYWNVNEELLISPRAQFNFSPKNKNITYRLSGGYYVQPPFYREMRDWNGNINKDVKAQKSLHAIAGVDYYMKIFNRPFKFSTEAYYKWLSDLISYDIDNVRIRYAGVNNSKGFARGIDFRLNGELVKDEESWVSLSFLQTREDIRNDYYTILNEDSTTTVEERGMVRRPTDQLVNFGLFFQDKLIRNPNFKVHLTVLFGTGFPFGPPNNNKFRNAATMPFYRRVDMGFSALLYDKEKSKRRNIFGFARSAWLSFEVFNVLGIQNTVSYIWINDIYSRQYAIPNYLTSRRFNLKLTVKI